ncbi:MAG: FAD:protein FMN transferase [Spirochaetia bacterium]|jgi:thiamine biosynthesis lipoprotein|nr:FAD:protein FMN transferase [Spirochaetia bacterium]
MKKIKSILIMLIISFTIISCNRNSIKPYSETGFALGTVCSITLYEKNTNFSFEEAFEIIQNIENKMSPVIKNSQLDQINSNAGVNPVRVSEDTYFVIEEGIKYANLADSKFDITIGPLVNLWGIGTENQNVPDAKRIESVLPLIGSQYISLNKNDKTVFLQNKNMSIDLGGIAKGYAADILKDFLLEKGFTKGIINLGGNVLTFGEKNNKIPWKIGIQNPVDSRGQYIGTIEISESSVVTSGIYERFFEKDNKRYHHILDPDSGYPVENELLSITIVAHTGIIADAYSTVAFSAGLVKGMDLLESTEKLEGIFITKDKKIFISSGLKDLFKLNSPDFTLGVF